MNICLVLAGRAFEAALADALALDGHNVTKIFPRDEKSLSAWASEIDASEPEVIMLYHKVYANFTGMDIARQFPTPRTLLIGIDHENPQEYCHFQYGDTLKLAQAHHRGAETADEFLRLALKLVDMLPRKN